MNHEIYALVGTLITLIGAIITFTWKISSLTTKLTVNNEQLIKKDKDLEEKIKIIDSMPSIVTRIEYLEKNHSLIPKISSKLNVLDERTKHLVRQSRPDSEGGD